MLVLLVRPAADVGCDPLFRIVFGAKTAADLKTRPVVEPNAVALRGHFGSPDRLYWGTLTNSCGFCACLSLDIWPELPTLSGRSLPSLSDCLKQSN